MGDLVQREVGTPPKLGWNSGGVRSTENVLQLRNGARGYYYGLIGSRIYALSIAPISLYQ